MRTTLTSPPILCALVLSLAGCSLLTPYEPELKQGNFVKEEQMRQLQPGMTPDQVNFLLGTPMISGESPDNRWIYPILEADGQYRNLIVEFDNGRVVRISEG
ncbi:MAG: outer membrane protein assembly factor BamE [Saccharospirillum sp.]